MIPAVFASAGIEEVLCSQPLHPEHEARHRDQSNGGGVAWRIIIAKEYSYGTVFVSILYK